MRSLAARGPGNRLVGRNASVASNVYTRATRSSPRSGTGKAPQFALLLWKRRDLQVANVIGGFVVQLSRQKDYNSVSETLIMDNRDYS